MGQGTCKRNLHSTVNILHSCSLNSEGWGGGGGGEEEEGGVRVLCQRTIHSFHTTTLHCFCEMTARAARTTAVTADDCKATKSFWSWHSFHTEDLLLPKLFVDGGTVRYLNM